MTGERADQGCIARYRDRQIVPMFGPPQRMSDDMALAGGVSLRIPQKTGYHYQEGSITSPDGHCRAFDANANGTTFGNGVGIVVL